MSPPLAHLCEFQLMGIFLALMFGETPASSPRFRFAARQRLHLTPTPPDTNTCHNTNRRVQPKLFHY